MGVKAVVQVSQSKPPRGSNTVAKVGSIDGVGLHFPNTGREQGVQQ